MHAKPDLRVILKWLDLSSRLGDRERWSKEFKMIYNFKLAILVVFFVSVGPAALDAQGQTGEAMSQARQRVAEFEKPLLQQLLAVKGDDNLRDSEKFRTAIVEFFSGLDDSAMRVAAMELLDSRYVYIVSGEIATELLGPLIRDTDPAVRVRAARAIGSNTCGKQYARELIAMLDGDPPTDALVSVTYAMGRSKHQPFVSHLVKLLDHADAEVCSAASFELTRLAPKQALEHNLRLLKDGQPRVRRAAIQNLIVLPGKNVIMSIERMLDDEDSNVRERAVWALGQMHSTGSADVVAKQTSDSDSHVRARAADVLGQLHAKQHVKILAALLKDEDVVVRRYATQAFGAMGEQQFIKYLHPQLSDADDQVREYAAEAIHQLETVSVSQETVEVGQKIDVIAKLMATNGFSETMRQIESGDPEIAIRMWSVGDGVLIVDYRKDDSISTDLSFLLTTDGPKSTRQDFSHQVKRFTPENDELTIIVPRQK